MASPAVLNEHKDLAVAAGTNTVAAPDGRTNFLVAASKDNVANYAREGNDLVVSFKNGQSMTIEGFFANGAQYNNLVFVQEDGRWLVSFDQAMVAGGDGIAEGAVLYEPIGMSTSTKALLGLLGLAAGVGIGAAAAGGGGGDSNPSGGGGGGNGGGGGGSGDGGTPPGGGTPPSPPTVSPVGNILPGSGMQYTRDAAPMLSGTISPPNGSVLIAIDGQPPVTITPDANGNWSYAVPRLGEGTHQIVLTHVNPDGTTSSPTEINVVVDTIVPTAPTLDPSSGTVLTGTAEAGSLVSIDLNGDGRPDATVTADANGNWRYALTTPLANGTVVSVTASDLAGNVSPTTVGTIDAAAPGAPLILQSDTSALAGTAEAGSTIDIDLNGDGTPDATVVADDNGNWSYTITTPIAAGAVVSVTASDAAGNVSTPSTATLADVTPPGLPTIAATNGSVLSGTAEANATVGIDLDGDGTMDVTVTATNAGTWTYTPATQIANGVVVTVTALDAAGNASQPATVTVDASPPPVPVVGSVIDDSAPVTGPLADGASTNDATPTLSGTAEANSTINILNGTTVIGTVTADINGNWSFTPATALPDGTYALTVTATDAVGNVSNPSAPIGLIIDTAPPAAPTIAATNGSTLSGTAVAGSTVAIDLNGDGVPEATVTATGGTWTYTPAPPLANGTIITVTALDAAGNASTPVSTTVDAAAPPPPVFVTVLDNVTPGTDPVASGGSTNDNTPTFTGTAEIGSTVNVYNGTALIGTALVDINGNWSVTPAAGLPDGTYSFTATATDPLGNISQVGGPFALTIDIAPPATPVITQSSATTLAGTAVAGSIIAIDLNGDGTADATVTATPGGTWTYAPGTPFPDGTAISVTAVDAAGNVSPPATVTIDAAPPAPPVIVSVTDNVTPTVGPVSNGGSTNDNTPTLAGTAEAGSTINIFNGTALLGTVVATGGNWTFTPPAGLADGTYTITVTATDAAGNASTPSAPYAITIDTAAPAAPVISGAADDALPVIAPIANGGATNDTTPTLSGTAAAGTIINLYNGTTLLGTTTADINGNWSVAPATGLTDATYTLTVTATDVAGNVSTPSLAYVITVDTAVPAAPTVIATNGTTLAGTSEPNATIGIDLDNDGTPDATVVANGSGNWSYSPATPLPNGTVVNVTATDAAGNTGPIGTTTVDGSIVDTTPPVAPTIAATNGMTLTGTAEAGSTVNLDLDNDGIADVSVQANGAGTWAYTPATRLPDGTLVSATATDVAGNTGPAGTVTVDGAPPPQPAILFATDPRGPVLSGGSTNDTTPTLTGVAEPGSTVTVYEGTTPLGTVVAIGGTWTFTPPTGALDGSHTYTVTATDAVGNISTPSTGYTVVVDTAAPGAPTIAPSNGTTLTGTAEAGSIVNLDLDGDGTADVTVTATGGTWSYTPGTPLGNGTVVNVTATDAAGNTSGATTLTIDRAAPAVPVIASVTDNAAPVTGPILTGGATNDNTPTLTGTAEANSTVNIFNGAALIGTVTAGPTGSWTFTPGTGLTDGTYTLTATATDAVGNTSAPTAVFTVMIDTVPPGTPTIAPTSGIALSGTADPGTLVRIDFNGDGTSEVTVTATPGGTWSYAPAPPLGNGTLITVTSVDAAGNVSAPATTAIDSAPPAPPVFTGAFDDTAPVTGPITTGGVTNDKTPTITGTAEANSTINLYNGTTLLGTVTANGSGVWTFTPTTDLPDGVYTVTATATDTLGNVGAPNTAFTFTIDTAPPAPPTIAPSNGTVISGTAAAGSTVALDFNGDGTADATVIATAGGTWTYTPTTPLLNGVTVSAVAVDAAGNASTPTTAIIDRAAPSAPLITVALDDAAPITGPILTGGVTNDTTPTISGTAEAGSTVRLFHGTTLLGTAVAGISGAWSITPSPALLDGNYSLTATATDPAGNVSGTSAAFNVVIDTTPPAAPTVGANNGTIGSVLSGTAAVGSSVHLDLNGDGTTDVTVAVTPGGTWSYTLLAPIANGTVVGVTATDTAGNVSTPATVTIDGVAPATPVLVGVSDNTAPVTGPVLTGGSTNDTTPTLTGTAEPNSTINVFNGIALLGTVVANANGNWSFTPATGWIDGTYTLTVTATDASGNISTPTGTFTLIVDTVAPPTPIIAASNGVTVTGTAAPDSTIALDLNGDGTADATVTANGGGVWTYTPAPALANGTTISAIAIDAAGNASAPATAIVDAAPPAAPVIVSVTDNVAPVTGPVLTGGSTNDNTPTLTGTAEANSTINIFNGAALLGTVNADINGNWTFTPATGLPDGTYTLIATATDAVGNTGAASTVFTVTIDIAPPAVPVIVVNTAATLSGTADAGSTIGLDLNNDGTVDTTVIANASGNWTYTPATPLANGVIVNVTAIDAAGNSSTPATVTIDAAPPPAPVLVSVTDNVGPVLGPVLTGGSTNDGTPTLAGTAEAGSTINIFNGTTLIGTVIAVGGVWSFTPPDDLADGTYTLTITATDAAGNVSTPSAPFVLTIDTVAPTAPVIASVTDNVGPVLGTVAPGGFSNDNTPTLAGTAAAGSTINIFNGAAFVGTATADATTGAWTFTPGTALPDATYTFTAVAVDAAGNPSTASASFAVTVDTAPPPPPTIALTNGTALSGTGEAGSFVNIDLNGDGTADATVGVDGSGNWSYQPVAPLGNGVVVTVTGTDRAGNTNPTGASTTVNIFLDDTTPPAVPTIAATNGTVLAGTAEAGSTVNIDLTGDGVADVSVTATAGGAWTYTPPTRLGNGIVVSVTATDGAGNTSPPASTIVDAAPPAAPVLLTVTDDVAPTPGLVLANGVTNDTTPTLTGTAEAGSLVSIFNGATLLGTVTATGGVWTFTPPALIDGTYTITTTATDAVGNTSVASGGFTFRVDTTPPALPTVGASNGTTLSGSAEAGSIVGLDFNGDGVADATVTATAGGTWTYTPTVPLVNGTVVAVTATDAAGNVSAPAGTIIDRLAPAVPILVSVTDDVAPVVGGIALGSRTNDTTPTLTGTAEAGSTISVFNGAALLGTVVADINGNWRFTTPVLANGTYALTVTATDAVGNISGATAPYGFIVDTIAPVAPVITRASGTTLTGTAEAGSAVGIDLNGDGVADVTVTATAGGTWSFSPSPALGNGIVIGVTSTDAAGNASPRVTATVDALAPTVPVINTVVDNVAPVVGNLASGASTNDTTPTLNGTGEVGALISVFNGATLLGTTLVDGTGNWSFTPAALANGSYALTVTATDASGNVSAPTAAFNVTIDTIAPTVTTAITTITDDTGTVGDWVTGDTTPIVGGTLSAALGTGEVLQVSLNGGATWTNAIVTGNTWQWYAPGVLTDGGYTISTRVVDAAGNIGGIASQALTINQAVAPTVAARDAGGLLGIVDANALGLIELGQQQFFAASDYNDNIRQVTVSFGGVLDLLALQTLNANQTLAAELGLRFSVVNNPGLLGIGASSVLTVTSLDGGPIDNLHLNEFLGSVTLSGGLLGINVGLLNSLSISATDTTGLTSASTASQLLSAGVLANLLTGSQPSAIIEGTTAANTLNGSAGDDRMYGYAGNDTLNGGGGNDLLRGGAGNDTLNGGAGNDILIGGSGNDTLTGGTGGDVFLWEVGAADNTGGNGSDVITDFTLATGPNQPGADRIDISALLVGYTADADGPAHYVNGVATIDAGDSIRNFLSVTNVNGNTVIAIDRDGTGTAFASQTLVTLNNVTTNLETLLANHQLVV